MLTAHPWPNNPLHTNICTDAGTGASSPSIISYIRTRCPARDSSRGSSACSVLSAAIADILIVAVGACPGVGNVWTNRFIAPNFATSWNCTETKLQSTTPPPVRPRRRAWRPEDHSGPGGENYGSGPPNAGRRLRGRQERQALQLGQPASEPSAAALGRRAAPWPVAHARGTGPECPPAAGARGGGGPRAGPPGPAPALPVEPPLHRRRAAHAAGASVGSGGFSSSCPRARARCASGSSGTSSSGPRASSSGSRTSSSGSWTSSSGSGFSPTKLTQ